MTKRTIVTIIVSLIILVVVGLVWGIKNTSLTPDNSTQLPQITSSSRPDNVTVTPSIPIEQPLTLIPLKGVISEARAEISGMAWYHDNLILLPQYPSRFGGGDGAVFSLAKEDLLEFINGTQTSPLLVEEIPFIAPGIEIIDGFEGFEAIAFYEDQVFLTIEARPDQMMGYLVRGEMDPAMNQLVIDMSSLREIPPQVDIENMTDEALLITSDGVITFFEANGRNINPSPVAHTFSLSGQLVGKLPMVNLEYRLTDVTPLDSQNHFWGINYFYPGDTKLLPSLDPLVELFGEGATHLKNTPVERLVQFELTTQGIVLTGEPPIQLQLLSENEARNWEAIAILDSRGFILATDKFPTTLLAFVNMP